MFALCIIIGVRCSSLRDKENQRPRIQGKTTSKSCDDDDGGGSTGRVRVLACVSV